MWQQRYRVFPPLQKVPLDSGARELNHQGPTYWEDGSHLSMAVRWEEGVGKREKSRDRGCRLEQWPGGGWRGRIRVRGKLALARDGDNFCSGSERKRKMGEGPEEGEGDEACFDNTWYCLKRRGWEQEQRVSGPSLGIESSKKDWKSLLQEVHIHIENDWCSPMGAQLWLDTEF